MKTSIKSLGFIVPSMIQIKQPKPRALKDEQSTRDRMEDQEKLQMLKDRQNFLRNPRFLPLNAQQGVTSLIQPRSRAARPVNATGERYSQAHPAFRRFGCCQNAAVDEGLCSIPAQAPPRLRLQSSWQSLPRWFLPTTL